MPGTYGQFCPVAKAMELLDERWTLLVVRELVAGSTHFNELRRGVPRMSPALLSKRLQTLVRAGVVERVADGNRVAYALTEAGRELEPVVEALGRWGVRWVPELGQEDLDPHLLMWDVHRRIDRESLPDGRTVLRFVFPDVAPPAREWWLVCGRDDVDVCRTDPGFDVGAVVTCDLPALVRVWRGDVAWDAAVRDGRLSVAGDPAVRGAVPAWLQLSAFAPVPRPASDGAAARAGARVG